MSLLRAILVEDEPSGMESLRRKLEQNCPEVEIIAECTSGEDAIVAIKENLPDVVFLDIMLGDMNGFDVLKEIKYPSFQVIFTTSENQFAIKAIKNSALDYLLKPIDHEELMEAVSKAVIKMREYKSPKYSPPINPVSDQQTRRLAAIMFTDIEGYTTMMQSNESKALIIRNRHRKVFETLHKKHKGTILQYYGDGTLSIFDSAIEAASCAISMQLAFQKEPKVPLRIGIHTGDILFTKDDVAGDGVNVAARIESMAVPGSIMVSDTIYEYLKNQPTIPLISMGSFHFKNVARKMEVFAVQVEGVNVPKPAELKGNFAPKLSKKTFLSRIPFLRRYF